MTKKRFHKPQHVLNGGGKDPARRLYGIFKSFHLDDFRTELSLWQQLALSNDQSAYDEGGAREDLQDFTYGLQKLIEGLHVINRKRNRKKIKKQLRKLPENSRKLLAGINRPVLLSAAEQAKPASVIKQFCKIFSRSYAEMELLDLLEAVITYEGNKTVCKGNLVLFYRHLRCLVRLAYEM